MKIAMFVVCIVLNANTRECRLFVKITMFVVFALYHPRMWSFCPNRFGRGYVWMLSFMQVCSDLWSDNWQRPHFLCSTTFSFQQLSLTRRVPENLHEKVRAWNVFVGTHPHPTVFPNGRIFGGRAPDRDQPRSIEGMKEQLFVTMPEVAVQLLHECVIKVQPGQYAVIYDKKGAKGTSKTVLLEEGTSCPEMRTLNRSAMKLDDAAPWHSQNQPQKQNHQGALCSKLGNGSGHELHLQ